MSLSDTKKKREQFLLTVYEMAEGEANREVDTKQLAERLGIDYDKEASKLGRYWREQGMVDWVSFGRVLMTGKGQAKAEELIEANDRLALETINCPNCQNATRASARFCDNCGTDLEKFNASTLQALSSNGAVTSITGDSWKNRVVGGKYTVGEKLGEGNIGIVFKTERTDIGLEAAIKLLHSRHVADRKAVERFKREAEAAGRIRHPNIVSILDFGEGDSLSPAFIVMELVEGVSLDRILATEGKLSQQRAVSLMREICRGVGAGHKLNILHRDLKPANIMVITPGEDEESERIKILDFGIAKLLDVSVGLSLTEAGAVMGTPFYMSPEQCLGEPLDPRSDVYSLGVLFYEMVAGVRPFEAAEFSALSRQHINKNPPALSAELNLAPGLVTAIMRALSKEKDERQTDATALALELKNIEKQPLVVVVDNTTELEQPQHEIHPLNAFEEALTFQGLEQTDELVFKASCERAMKAGHLTHISVPELVKELKAIGIGKEDLLDSLEIIANEGYIEPSDMVGCGMRICDFKITSFGFEQYALRYLSDYEAKRQDVTVDIVERNKDAFEKPDIITRNILDALEADGLLRIAKFAGGTIKIMHVSAQLKRQYKNHEARVATDFDGEPQPESVASKAAKLAGEARYKQERELWLRSAKAREDAQTEVKTLFDELSRLANAISEQGVEIQTGTSGEEYFLRWRGISLLASWNSGRFANTLEGTGLTMKLSETSEPKFFINTNVSEKIEIRKTRYDIDMAQSREVGWRETSGSKQVLSSHLIANIWVNYLIEEVEKRLATE